MARSYLFIPGNVPRMLQNMDVYEADAVIVDFEDAISEYEKDEARFLTKSFLTTHSVDVDVYIRINAEEPHLTEDIALINTLPIKGIVVPKSTVSFLRKLTKKINSNLDILALVETPNAFFQLDKIAAIKQVEALLLGAEDLMSIIGGIRDERGQAILHARSQIIMAARAKGKRVIDTPWTTLNEDKLHMDILAAVTLGFDGKMAIHPNQVIAINNKFSPSPAALEEAKRIVMMYHKKNTMRFSLDGKMIDKPIIQYALDLIEKARQYGLVRGDNDDL